MNIYFDTEFTGLVPNTRLISIGMVTENDEKFYAEFTDYDTKMVTPWIKKNVIAHLTDPETYDYCYSHMQWDPEVEIGSKYSYAHGNTAYICDKLTDWLNFVSTSVTFDEEEDDFVIHNNEQIVFVADVCHYDMYLLVNQIFGGAMNLPKNVSPVCYDICQDIADLKHIENFEERTRPMPLRRVQAGSYLKYSNKVGDWDISAERMNSGFNASREALCKIYNSGRLPEGNKHNALYDAEVVKMIYEGMRR